MKKAFKIICRTLEILITLVIISVFSIIFIQRISNNSVNLFGYSIYTVVTGSMEPKYGVNDLIFVEKVNTDNLKIGDDIAYKGEKQDFAGKIVTHRIIDKKEENGEYVYTTKGIANNYADPEIKGNQILGKVKGKLIILSFLSGIINDLYGFYFLVFVPIVIIVFLEVMDSINEKRGLEKENEQDKKNKENN